MSSLALQLIRVELGTYIDGAGIVPPGTVVLKGTRWHVGDGDPADSIGLEGDLYLSAIGEVWQRGAAGWGAGPVMALGGGGSSGGGILWVDISGKPTSFTPSAHAHAQSDVTGLVQALASRALVDHSHAIANVTGLEAALAAAGGGGGAVTSVAGRTGAVVLAVADISGLEAALATAGAVSSVAGRTGAVVLAVADIGGLAEALTGKAAAAHAAAHATGGADALTPAGIGAAAVSHGHAQADVAGLAPFARLTTPIQTSSATANNNLASIAISGLVPGDVLAIEALYDGSVEASYKRTGLAVRKSDNSLQSLVRIDFTGVSNSGVMYQARLLCLTESTFVFWPYPIAVGQVCSYISTAQPFSLELNGWVDLATSWLRLLWARVTKE